MRILIVGASRGLGRALYDGLRADGHEVWGVARSVPGDAAPHEHWIAADFAEPQRAADAVAAGTPERIDAILYNLGIWEPAAFSDEYDFTAESDATSLALVATNITGPLLLLQRLVPRLLASAQPRLILTGSTSGLPRSGRPEVAFGASKAALGGIADALREQFRPDRLAVTTLQIGDLNTDDALEVPREAAAERGAGTLIPVHDVVDVVRTVLGLSSASFVREIVLPAIRAQRF